MPLRVAPIARHASPDSTVKQPLRFRHASSPLLFAARGRRRVLHSRPLARGRAERRVPVAPLGLMRMRSSASECASGLSDALGEVPGVPPAVFFQPACTLPQRTIRSPKLWSHGGGTGSLKRESRTRFDLVVRHTVQGSFHLKVGRLLASGSAGADPSCPKTDVTHEPRNAASPASTASHPANVTIAIAPLGGAGRNGI
ncbi:hypothetical protein SAMN03159423_4494 [Bradyrhizobium sp. NFR13]|nr:hypothetical protein SAMN03159423_4494 [Bradyrhizobium sp. NFR13]